MSRHGLPNPPTYDGADPDVRRLFAWMRDLTEALDRELDDIRAKMLRKGDPVPLPQATKAQLAAARFRADPAARLIYVTDDVGGATPAFSDGASYRRTSDRAVIS